MAFEIPAELIDKNLRKLFREDDIPVEVAAMILIGIPYSKHLLEILEHLYRKICSLPENEQELELRRVASENRDHYKTSKKYIMNKEYILGSIGVNQVQNKGSEKNPKVKLSDVVSYFITFNKITIPNRVILHFISHLQEVRDEYWDRHALAREKFYKQCVAILADQLERVTDPEDSRWSAKDIMKLYEKRFFEVITGDETADYPRKFETLERNLHKYFRTLPKNTRKK